MDKKTPQHKFNPLYHPAPAMNPRPPGMAAPGGLPTTGTPHPHPHMATPSSAPKPVVSMEAPQSGFGPSSSAFEMMYSSALPTLAQPQHIETPPPQPPPLPQLPPLPSVKVRPPLARSISTVSGPLRFRRERMMLRHHTLQSETSFDRDTPQSDTVPPSPTSLLAPPDVRQTKCVQLELPPHRRDTLDKIPRRARSQSWLVRTRHLLDDDKALSRTPWIAHCLYALSVLFLALTFPFCLPFCVKVAREYERVVVFRTGRLIKGGTKGPGMFFILPCIDTYRVVDLRVLSFDVPAQEILSRDSVTVSVEAVIYFRISNPIISVTNVNDAQFSTKLLAQTTLRNVLGTKTLSEILQERDNISSVTEKVLDEGTDPWGVKVQRVEIKDIRLPQMLTRAMATEAEASRDARARVIAADGERNASHNLVEAANVISKNRVALHLRFLQTLSHIASEHNHTVVIPVSMEIMRAFRKKMGSFFDKDTGTKAKV